MITMTTVVRVVKNETKRFEAHVYFSHQGEDLAHSLLWRRHRPVQLYFDLLPAILMQVGIVPTDDEKRDPTKLGEWDQLAGCSCGCSPGIVLDRSGRYELHVTIESRTEVTDAEDTSAVPR